MDQSTCEIKRIKIYVQDEKCGIIYKRRTGYGTKNNTIRNGKQEIVAPVK